MRALAQVRRLAEMLRERRATLIIQSSDNENHMPSLERHGSLETTSGFALSRGVTYGRH